MCVKRVDGVTGSTAVIKRSLVYPIKGPLELLHIIQSDRRTGRERPHQRDFIHKNKSRGRTKASADTEEMKVKLQDSFFWFDIPRTASMSETKAFSQLSPE